MSRAAALLPALALILMASPARAGAERFEKNIRPLFGGKCGGCHNEKTKMGGLDLSSAEGFLQGGAGGALVDLQDPGKSLLLEVLSYESRIKMPPTGKLDAEEIERIRAWVEQGATWPGAAGASVRPHGRELTEADRNHWAFCPIRDPAPPRVERLDWARNPIDLFLLAKLEQAGLEPAPPAGDLTLLRRLSYNLTGLPPTLEEIEAFERDSSPFAWENLVERLLASPRYGERWGRHWLDVARYAESTGMDEDHGYPYAWRYRDYVIGAFNADLPYDRFVVEQLAGDLLPAPEGGAVNRQGIVATGFLALGPKPLAQQDRVQMIYDVIDEQIDAVSKAFLGVTLACARCHDHKFDPFSQADYYRMAAIFANTKNFRDLGRPGSVSYIHYSPLDPVLHEAYEAHRERIWRKQLEMEEAIAQDLEASAASRGARLADYLEASWKILNQSAPAALLAEKKGLDFPTLDRWLCLLAGSDQPYWQAFREADVSSIAAVAARYQEQYESSGAKWRERLASWRERFEREALLDRALPGRPNVDPEEHPLYAEVTADGAPFALRESARAAALRRDWKELEGTLPPAPPMASAVADHAEPVVQRVFMRGSHHSPGEPVDKGLPAVIAEEQPSEWRGSGRLELARWIASPQNPLTARVMVNRIWQWHFGEGLVRSANNWGVTGEEPTHPELLDWLASRFIESGWSVKAIHRLILGSTAYRMSVQASPEADPGNRLWSHFSRQRLTVEALRDSLLLLDGSLDGEVGGNLMAGKPVNARPDIDPDETRRRTVYIPIRRGSVLNLHATFDFGDATTPSAGRDATNVAPQALFMRNSRFVIRQAEGMTEGLLSNPGLSDSRRIERAYLAALTRRPEPAEIDEALSFIASMERRFEDNGGARLQAWRSFCHVLLSTNEFLYLN